MSLKIGLIGGGGDAWPHLSAHVHSQRVRTVSLAEGDEATVARLRDRFGIIKRVTADYRELLADPEIAVVDLCLPPAEQEAAALEALAAGKHVLCSAPLTASIEGAEALIEAARAADRRLFCMLFQRFIPAHVRTRALLEEGGIGAPVFGSVSVQMPQESAAPALAAERCHALDTLQSFLGPVRRVSAMQGVYSSIVARPDRRPESGGVASRVSAPRATGPADLAKGKSAGPVAHDATPPDSCKLQPMHSAAVEGQPPTTELLSLEFQRGALGQITILATGAERLTAERRLVGPEGTILIRDNPDDELPLVVLQGDGFFPVKLKAPPDVREYAIMAAMEHFLSCVEQGTPETVTAGEAVAALRVSLAADQALREGCAVTVVQR